MMKKIEMSFERELKRHPDVLQQRCQRASRVFIKFAGFSTLYANPGITPSRFK